MMNWKNDITKRLNIAHPIVQAPMLGVGTPEMVAAAARAGVLGSLPLGDLGAADCITAIRATRSLTDQPFAVNIFVNEIPEVSDTLKQNYKEARNFIQELAAEYNLDVVLPHFEEIRLNSYHDQVDAFIAENCTIVSFTFGNLDDASIEKLKRNGTILIGTCTSVGEAIALEASGIDILTVQGIEAGGHRGSFDQDNFPEIGGISLLSKVYDAVKVPLIYAGGLYNAKTIRSAEILGAQGFQIGSLLLGSAESALQEFEKQRLRNADENELVLTKSFSGRYARGLRNIFIEKMDQSGHILPYPYQNKLTAALRKIAKASKNTDFLSIWAGQSLHDFSGDSTTVILERLIGELNQA